MTPKISPRTIKMLHEARFKEQSQNQKVEYEVAVLEN